jgi:L-fucose isomerase-like protein
VSGVLAIAIGRPTFDLELAAEQVAGARAVLAGLTVPVSDHVEIVTDIETLNDRLASMVDDPALVVVLQATFTDSSFVGRIADRFGAPMLIWSFPEPRTGGRLRLNSLCGANLAAYLLRRRGVGVGFVHVEPSNPLAPELVESGIDTVRESIAATSPAGGSSTTARDLGSVVPVRVAGFAGRRIGVVGEPPAGFEPCEGDGDELRRITGIEVERVPLGELFAAADDVEAAARLTTSQRVSDTMDVADEVRDAGMDRSIGLYGGLATLVDRHRWSAVATRCWPECMTEYGGAMCTPMAMLTEDGVPGVCEADLFGAATALILEHLSGTDPFIADLVDADTTDETSVVWHCGVASASLAEPSERRVGITHPNRHRALVNQFALRPGRVTVARLSQSANEIAMVIGGGEILRRPRPFQGTCGVLRWDRPIGDVMSTVFDRGLEHHLGIVYGDHREALAALAAQWRLPVVELG